MARRRSSQPPEPGPGGWKLEIYEKLDGSCPYSIFFNSLDPYSQLVLDISVEKILGRQGHNVCGTSWGTPLGRGLYEFRVRRSLNSICKEVGLPLPEGFHEGSEILLRVFFAVEGARVILLLSGYDKGKDSKEKRQDREIKIARKILREHKRS